MHTRTKRAFSLVEILVAVVIIGILAAILLPRYLGGGKNAAGQKTASPMQRAKGVDCANNLSQIRLAYQAATIGDEENRPKSLAELKGLSPSMLVCPVGKEPYQFDPATGQVRCVHPGH
jgi:prepilin-type N-terminal cleavage/methylation domain-containing protein